MGKEYYDRYQNFKVDGTYKPLPFIRLESKPTDKSVVYRSEFSRLDRLSQKYYNNMSLTNNNKLKGKIVMKQPNYSSSMTAQIIDDYQNGRDISEIATSIGKSVRSVRSKLVREGVYIPQEKTSRSNKVQEPTKKELLRTLDGLVDFPTTGLLGATKESILDLIKFAEKQK